MEPAAVDSPVPGGGRDHQDDAPDPLQPPPPPPSPPPPQQQQQQKHQQQQKPSRYESQKRRDWNTFLQFLSNHYKPALPLALCGGPHVVEFLKYLDQFGKTKVHVAGCSHFGLPRPPGPCGCPTRQAWGSLDALIGRLRAAYDENASPTAGPGPNPFGARAVKAHLREVRESQAKARGVAYDKKKRKRRHQLLLPPSGEGSSSAATTAATSTAVTVAVAGSSTAAAAATDQGGSLGIRDPGHADEIGNLTSDS